MAERSAVGMLDEGSSVAAWQPITIVETNGEASLLRRVLLKSSLVESDLSLDPEQTSSGQASSDELAGSDPSPTPMPTPEVTAIPALTATATPSPRSNTLS